MRLYGQSNKGIEARRNDTGLRRAEPGRLRVRPLAGRVLTAVLLAAFVALLALTVTQAQAQTTAITLVSNTAESLEGLNSDRLQAQKFRTGASTGGYTISDVGIRTENVSGKMTSLKIRENNISNLPGALVATLNNPATLTSNSLNTFTAPAGTTLAANTPYWITINEGITSSNRASYERTASNTETGEAGWSIGDNRLWRASAGNSWSTSTSPALIQIRGTTGGTTASTDATLSDLALLDGNSNDIPLAFASDDHEYEVSVVNGIDSVVLSATKNDGNAMVVITNDDDPNTPNEAELRLNVGSNTLTVTVTAEDGSTELIYTVTVERLAAPPPPEVMVPSDWGLIPSGLDTGDHFRCVLFLSSIKTDATSTDIADYNTFIKNRAAVGHTDIQAYSAGFRAVGCTDAVNARNNTNTDTDGADVPIYWLNGNKIADDNAGFYDGGWDDEANDKNESGTDAHDTSEALSLPFTGCDHNGTKAIAGANSRALGASQVRLGHPNSSVTHAGPLSSAVIWSKSVSRPMYGISQVFEVLASTDVTLSGPYIRSILVPYDLELGEKALPEEEITVWAGYPFYENMYVVAKGDRWSPSGVWGDPAQDMIWVVDPIHFGIHALKLSALKDGLIERHIAADTSEFDYRFNYNCHFKRTRAGGDHGNPALTVMWGDDSTIWVANDEIVQLDAYSRDGSLILGCYTQNVTAWTDTDPPTPPTPTTAPENFKTPFTRDESRDYPLQTGGPLTVRGIWSDGMTIWISGPPGNIYTIDMEDDGQVAEAPGFDGHYDAYGLWSDGTTMWVATRGRLRAYNLDDGARRAALDVRLRGNQTPGDMWSEDGTTIWITYGSGSIEVYRLPERSGGVSQATEAEPLTASFASAPDGHDGESGFTFRIAFSEEVEITPEDMRDHALLVSGGTVTDAAGVDGRNDLWELTVEPTSTGPVSISVLQGRACTETGALCTADGRALTSSLALRVAGPQPEPVNSPATGRPAISGTAEVGETLTVDTSDIGDADGLTNVTFSYQWIVSDGTSDTDIAGETDATHILSASDEGKTIKVRVSFTDDAANEETLTSAATGEVAGEVTADPPGRPRNLTGAANADGTVTLRWDAPNDDSVTGYKILRRRPREGENTLLVHVNDTGNTATEYTDNDVTPDVRHAYRVKAINAVGISRRSNFVSVTPAQPAEPAQNSPATGAPAINGTIRVGEELTADTTGITDADGLTNVSYNYQWIVSDGGAEVDITGATESTYTLVAADKGWTIKVRVRFTDDAGNDENLTSVATPAVTDTAPTERPPATENLTAVENAGTKYVYRVKAINDAGVGPRSGRVMITTND